MDGLIDYFSIFIWLFYFIFICYGLFFETHLSPSILCIQICFFRETFKMNKFNILRPIEGILFWWCILINLDCNNNNKIKGVYRKYSIILSLLVIICGCYADLYSTDFSLKNGDFFYSVFCIIHLGIVAFYL